MNQSDPYPLELLLHALHSGHERVAIWGAYQLARQGMMGRHLEDFLQSSFATIQEAGMSFMSENNDNRLLSEVVGIFRESEGQLKHAAGLCLASFPNDFSKNLLTRWFDQTLNDEHATRLELESATRAVLRADPQGGFQRLAHRLKESLSNLVQASVILRHLLPAVRTQQDLDECIDDYFALREAFSDTELTHRLIEAFGQFRLLSWLDQSLSAGYSLISIYEQFYLLFGREVVPEVKALWVELQQEAVELSKVGSLKPKNPGLFLELLLKWLNRLLKEESQDLSLLKKYWLVQAFLQHAAKMKKGIPKILEMETNLLLGLPLILVKESSFKRWHATPSRYFSSISNYYHSPLLTQEHCEQLLELFFPELPSIEPKDLVITKALDRYREKVERPEILWSLFRGELFGYEVDWPRFFPNPYLYSNLPALLVEIYLVNFEYYLRKKNVVAIDYALQLFQRVPSQRVREISVKYFNELINHHVEMFTQLLEYHPEPDLIPSLLARFREGETSLAPSLEFLCVLYDQPLPQNVAQEVDRSHESGEGPKRGLRLYCRQCQSSFPYYADELFIDVGALQRTKRLISKDLWAKRAFVCKKCDSPVPLELDEIQLEELARQSRVESLFNLKLSSTPNPLGHRIHLLDFPRYQGKTYNPAQFIALVKELEGKNLEEQEQKWLWMKLAQLYRSMSQWEEMIQLLERFEPLHSQAVEWAFFMGQGRMKQGKFNEARPYFERLAKGYPHMPSESAEYSYIEKARYWLKSLDSYAVKRARFQVFGGKK